MPPLVADGRTALDMMHGAPAIADQVITAGAYEDLADADLICITAGLRRSKRDRLFLRHPATR